MRSSLHFQGLKGRVEGRGEENRNSEPEHDQFQQKEGTSWWLSHQFGKYQKWLGVPQVLWYNPELVSSWWFRPTHLNNMLVNLDHSKRLSVNIKKSLKPPPRGIACLQQNLSSRKLSFLVVHLPGFKLFTWFWKHILENGNPYCITLYSTRKNK